MKIKRSSKCYFNKWLTQKKKKEIKEILSEYARICNFFVENYQDKIPEKTKFDLSKKEYVHDCILKTETYLTARLIRCAFREAYSAIMSAKSNAENREDKKYFKPIFHGKRMVLSEICNDSSIALSTILFDFNLTLKCLRRDIRGYKISIPLKRHKQFNKWNNLGKLAKSIIVSDKYVIFSFEIETGKKKTSGDIVGIDFGIKKLCTISNNTIIGKDIYTHILELQAKTRCSKGYYRKKEEIKEYIDREVKNINFKDKQLIVVEDLKGMKHKMKERATF